MANETNLFKETVTYWCNICDAKKVTSDNPKTGRFYLQYGHDYKTGNYVGVFYALCPDCMKIGHKPLD